MEIFISILLSALASSGLFSFIQFLINRKDHRIQEQLDDIKKNQEIQERDNCRTQMLILMNHYQKDTVEIMKLAQHYFLDLRGDWYMTSIFNKWLEANGIGKPEWFNPQL